MTTEAIQSLKPVQMAIQPPAPELTPAKPADKDAREDAPAPAVAPTLLVAGDLVIEIDHAAKRFVNKLFDPSTQELTRQFPSDGQLAFSRGLNAYMQTLHW